MIEISPKMIGEMKRKSVHLVAIVIPLGYCFLSQKFAITGVALATMGFIIFDFFKIKNRTFRKLVFRFLSDMFRHKEVHYFTASAFILFSSLICILFFNRWVAVISITYIVIGDVFAAILGRLYGKHKVYGNRSLEGTLAFFLSAAAFTSAMWFVPYDVIPVYYRIAGALLAALVELVIPQIDDNLSVPILSGMMLQFALAGKI